MTNYTIDGSVYTFPFNKTEINENQAECNYKDAMKLGRLLLRNNIDYHKQPGNNHYYFLEDDIVKFIKLSGLSPRFTRDDFNYSERLETYKHISQKYKDAIELLNTLFCRIGFNKNDFIRKSYNRNNDDKYYTLKEYCRIDTWFDIENISFIPDKELVLPDYIKESTQDA